MILLPKARLHAFQKSGRGVHCSFAYDFGYPGVTMMGINRELLLGLECQRINSLRKIHTGSLASSPIAILHMAEANLTLEDDDFVQGIIPTLCYIRNLFLKEWEIIEAWVENNPNQKQADQSQDEIDLVNNDWLCSFCQGEIITTCLFCQECRGEVLICAWCVGAGFYYDDVKYDSIAHNGVAAQKKPHTLRQQKRRATWNDTEMMSLCGKFQQKRTKHWFQETSKHIINKLLSHAISPLVEGDEVTVWWGGHSYSGCRLLGEIATDRHFELNFDTCLWTPQSFKCEIPEMGTFDVESWRIWSQDLVPAPDLKSILDQMKMDQLKYLLPEDKRIKSKTKAKSALVKELMEIKSSYPQKKERELKVELSEIEAMLTQGHVDAKSNANNHKSQVGKTAAKGAFLKKAGLILQLLIAEASLAEKVEKDNSGRKQQPKRARKI